MPSDGRKNIFTDRQLRLANPAMERFRGLILYNLEAGEAVLTDNNDVQIYTDGRKKFEALLREIYAAQHYIHMQYYIIKNDELWQTIEKALIQKAREGVEVRILFDSMGCRTMRNRDWERLEKEGNPGGGILPGFVRAVTASCELPESPEDRGDRWKGRICGRI